MKKKTIVFGILLSAFLLLMVPVESAMIISKTDNNSIIFELPDYFSWKDYHGKDWTTPAKNQYAHSLCAACCIFAGIGIFESVIKIREGYADFNPDLSEQYVLSCLPAAGNCKDGTCDFYTYQSIVDDGFKGNYCNGVVLESCLPYEGRDAAGYSNSFLNMHLDPVPCLCKCDDWEEYLVPLKEWGSEDIKDTSDERHLIKELIIEKGPVTSGFLYPMLPASWNNPLGLCCKIIPFSFFYWGLINHDPNAYFPVCKTFFPKFGHAIAIVGWKDNSSIENGGYWICKNSWGTNWGYDGFFNLEYGSLVSIFKVDNSNKTTFISWVEYDPDSYEWSFEII